MRQNIFEKKLTIGKMLIEQNIEFELKWPGPLCPTCILLNVVIFMTKQKSPKQILGRLFSVKNIAGGNVP